MDRPVSPDEKLTDSQSREGVLRRRLLVAFLAVSLVPLFGSNGIGYVRSRVIVEGLVGRYLDGVAELQAVHLQDRLDQRLLYLEAIATGNRFLQAAAERGRPGAPTGMSEAAVPEAVTDYLRRKLAESGRFEALALFNPDGTLVATTSEESVVSEWPIQQAQEVTLLRPDRNLAPTLRMTVPVRDDAGRKAAVLAATIPLGQAAEFLDIPEHVAGSIESFLLDERGRPLIVSHPHGHLEYHQPLNSPLIRRTPGSRARYRDRDGVDVIGASARLPRYSWLFLTEVPTADALGELTALRRLSLYLGGVFAALVVVAGWVLAGGIVAPVRRLVTATRRVAAGHLEARVAESGGDEIGELTDAFNEMAAELQAKEERIERLHRQEIERAEQLATVGQLASGLAHEIKNPVVGISNGLDLVLRRSGGDPELRPITSEMKHQLSRIEGAVRDLLAFARPPRPSFSPCDVNDIVTRALTLVHPAAEKQGVVLDLELARDLPSLEADDELLRQAIVNLVMNAVQFSRPGDQVRIVTARRGSAITIAIVDHGPGMDDEVVAQLFKPFFTTRHSGTGLGLSITRGIVEGHGGRMEVDTVPEAGSTFTVVIPLGAHEGAAS